jgi:hypothetical protein
VPKEDLRDMVKSEHRDVDQRRITELVDGVHVGAVGSPLRLSYYLPDDPD